MALLIQCSVTFLARPVTASTRFEPLVRSLSSSCVASKARHERLLSVRFPSIGTTTIVRNAGHNKWSNIRHIKAANDLKMAKLTNKYINLLRFAIMQSGGQTDPDKNPTLTKIMMQGMSENVPKASLEKALKTKGGALVETLQEVRGPGNCFILVEMMTKSRRQAESEVRRILAKKGGVVEKGVINLFTQRGQIVGKPPSSEGYDQDKAEEDAIEMGAEEVELLEEEGMVEFLCSPNDFPVVKTKVEERQYEILSSGVNYIPSHWVGLETEKEQTSFSNLIEAMENSTMVTAVHHNVTLS